MFASAAENKRQLDNIKMSVDNLLFKVEKNRSTIEASSSDQKKRLDLLEIDVDKIKLDDSVRFKKLTQLDALTSEWLTEYKFYKEKRI